MDGTAPYSIKSCGAIRSVRGIFLHHGHKGETVTTSVIMQAKSKAKAAKEGEEDEEDDTGGEEEEQEEAAEHAETATEQPQIGNKAVVGPSLTPDSKSPADKSKSKIKAKKRPAN